jgi:hypothetical protein
MFASTSPGHANDPRLGAPLRHQMINLTILINAFFFDRALVRAVNLLAMLGLAGSYIWMIRRCRLSADSLLSLSILCGLTLLPVYHRAYDAAILVVAYGWALAALGGPLRPAARATLAAMALLLVPFDLLMMMNRRLGMFNDAAQTWFWQAIIAPHHAWAALATSVCLLGALRLRLAQLSPADQDPEEARLLPQVQLDQRALETADRWLVSTRTT